MLEKHIESHIAPRTLPFLDQTTEALMICAEKRLGEVLDLIGTPYAMSAKLWLHLATTFAKARSEIVRSIIWQQAPEETRFEVALELEHQGEEVIKYLSRFKKHWNKAIDGYTLDDLAELLPVPSYCNDEEGIEIYRSVAKDDIYTA